MARNEAIAGAAAVAQSIPAGAALIGSVKLSDGVNTFAIKAATVPAVANDPSIVVALSPNSPAGQGAAAGVAGAWPVKNTDGVNIAAVKAAGTAPVAADPALVVSVSPNTLARIQPNFANPTVGQGNVTAPAAAAVVADTGALAAGTYRVEVAFSFSDAVAAGKGLSTEHRNAANAANIGVLGGCSAGGQSQSIFERVVVALNERVRVVNMAVAGAAGSRAEASIRAYLLQ